MTTRSLLLLALPFLLTVGCAAVPEQDEDMGESGSQLTNAPAASSSQRDVVVDQARADRLVGEQSTGYLGLVEGDVRGTKRAPSDLSRRVSHINIQRRALYTEIAQRRGVTVSTVAEATACKLFEERVEIGEAYRTEDETWALHTASDPVEMPAFCTNIR